MILQVLLNSAHSRARGYCKFIGPLVLFQGAESSPVPTDPPALAATELSEEFGKGVVFYMKGKRVVGVVLWNVFNRMPIARKVSFHSVVIVLLSLTVESKLCVGILISHAILSLSTII